MDFKGTNFYNKLSNEDKILVSRISDYVLFCRKSYATKFSFFLNERQCALVESVLKALRYSDYKFYGGYKNANRKVLAIYSSDNNIISSDFPINTISFSFKENFDLSHRDFLGAIMALQIKREMVGDILLDNGIAYVFFYNTISDYILSNITKIGSVGVELSTDVNFENIPSNNYEELKGTIASLRLDNIAKLVTKLSREKVNSIIKSIGIDVNYVNIKNASSHINEGDVFSIRGYGKFELKKIQGISKKNRVHVLINKFI